MTRINAGIKPSLLHRRHLIAEYREITMVPAALRRSLRTKTIRDIKNSIPKAFTLNSGHVKFFYDKQKFLQDRFSALCSELESRGYRFDKDRGVAFEGLPEVFYSDWNPTEIDNAIVWERIKLRISEKPHLYE